MRLHPVLRNFQKSVLHNHRLLIKARVELTTAQQALVMDNMIRDNIAHEKTLTAELIKLQELEEKILRQKSKLREMEIILIFMSQLKLKLFQRIW